MAQTLLYLDEVLAGFPDNISQLILPVNIRDQIVSTMRGVGFLEETTNVTVPITDGVWTAINPLLPAPVHTETLWTFDGNNAAVSNYAALTDTVVPAGYSKLGAFVSVLELTKSGGGSDNYQVSYTKNGVTFGEPESVEFPEAGVETLTLLHSFIADVSVPDAYGVQIQGVGTSADLELGFFSMQVSDSILLTAPVVP